MMNVDSVMEEAEQRCKQRGVRLTAKRKQVLSGLVRSDTALSAYELVDYCREEYGNAIPPMSVYRILDFLQQQHLVHKLSLANKYVACAHISCGHEHGAQQFLICGRCQRVEEVTVGQSTIDALNRNVEEAGFRLLSTQLEMHCLCEDCLEK